MCVEGCEENTSPLESLPVHITFTSHVGHFGLRELHPWWQIGSLDPHCGLGDTGSSGEQC